MPRVILIEDNRHSELQKLEFADFEAALQELRRRAAIPWNETPNRAPCSNWRKCGREYWLVQFDNDKVPWNRLRGVKVLTVLPHGVSWSRGYEQEWAAGAAPDDS